MAGLQRRHVEAFPGAQVVGVTLSRSRAFADGKNLLGLRNDALREEISVATDWRARAL